MLGRQFAALHACRALIHLGRVAEVLARWEEANLMAGLNAESGYSAFRALLLAHQNRRAEHSDWFSK